LAVQGLDGRGYWEAGGQRGCAELGCTAAWGEDGADGDVFDQGGVDAGAFNEGFEGAVEEVGALCVFEAALAALGEGGAEGTGYDDLGVGVSMCLLRWMCFVEEQEQCWSNAMNLHRRRASQADSPFPSFHPSWNRCYHRCGYRSEQDAPGLRRVSYPRSQ
jgi:hypothetical protein